MTVNKNIAFNLTRGNPYSNQVGMSADKVIFGQSIGGKIFRKEIIANSNVVYPELLDGNIDIFDPIVPSDVIDNLINYRAVFIANYGVESVVLDTIVAEMVLDPIYGIQVGDVDIAVEGIYTIREVSRPIPVLVGKAENPSIYLDDEYDSTGKLSGMVFKKTLDVNDLPTDIPFDCALKIWLRRKVIVTKATMPDQQITEGFTLTINEYDSTNSTSLLTNYVKNEGRISLSNWYDWTIPFGKNTRVSMREIIPKEVDITTFNPINIYTNKDKLIVFYWTAPTNSLTKNYAFLVVEPNSDVRKNKYINVFLNFEKPLYTDVILVSDDLIDTKKSFYDPSHFYFFWKRNLLNVINKCDYQFIGEQTEIDEVFVHILDMTIWTGSVFDNILEGYANRRIENYNVIDSKLLRNEFSLINVEQFEDLFVMFGQDTVSKNLKNLIDVNISRNEILYVFEKDIIDSKKNTTFKHNQQPGIEVFAQRLFPKNIPTEVITTSFNNTKSFDLRLLLSTHEKVSGDTYSPREIKYLLDGTRYVDLNSFHHREFKIGTNYWTYELPTTNSQLKNVYITTSFAIENDDKIYDHKLSTYSLVGQISNIVGSEVYPRPQFQQNIIDLNSSSSLSYPIEWKDRVYRDQWITLFSTLPDEVEQTSFFTVQYNFKRNLWKAIYYDRDGNQQYKIYDHLDGQNSTTTSPTTASPVGKDYTQINILDLDWVIEPDVYQPFTIKASATTTGTELKLVNYKIYFKGNVEPVIDILTYAKDIRNISYFIFNPDQYFNSRLNYLEVGNADNFNVQYHVKNFHPIVLNKISWNISKEYDVNPQYREQQAEFKWYRKIEISGLPERTGDELIGSKIVIPIILYGNGYKIDGNISPTSNLAVKEAFNFSHIGIRDFSMRLYKDSDMTKPLSFKLSKIDWDHDFAVIWVDVKDFTQTKGGSLYLFYGNLANTKVRTIFEDYNYLRKNLYSNTTFGAWHFDTIIDDTRAAFVSGKVLNAGEPWIYEKTDTNEIRLSQIDKEYMFGLAKIYKSHYFDLELEVPKEESLLFDAAKKDGFEQFIRDATRIFKPSYTEIHTINKLGIDIFEVGGGNMAETQNKRVAGLVALTPNQNVNTYYERTEDVKFNILTSFNGYSESVDWIVSRPLDTTVFKAGVYKVNGKLKSDTITFDSPFKNTDYFVFFSSPVNQKIYFNQLCPNRFNITASHFLQKEVSWMAFHRDIFGGVYTPDTIFCGSRTLQGYIETPDGESPTTPNLDNWYNSELWIKPEIGVQGDPGSMTIDPTDPGYSVILSSNENINMYWTEKSSDGFRIKTSSPAPCVVHWLVVKNGVEWWNEII